MPTRQGNLFFISVLLSVILCCGCAADSTDDPAALSKPILAIPSIVDITPTETLIPTVIVPTEISTTDPTSSACSRQSGEVSQQQFKSRILHGEVKYSLYLPPCYDPSTTYPVLYLLHGLTYTDDQWIRLGVPATADRLIQNGEIKPLVIVMPYNPGPTLPPTNTFGQVLIEELLPKIEAGTSACNTQNCRMIGGLSRGGGWAYDIYVHNPGMFSKVAGHSPAMFKHDARYLVWWIKNAYQGEALWLDIGDKDPETGYILDIQRLLTEEDIQVTVNIWPGVHDEEYWKVHVEDYLRWYMQGY